MRRSRFVDLIVVRLAHRRMQVLDNRVERRPEDLPLTSRRDDFVVDVPMLISLMTDRIRAIPRGADVADVVGVYGVKGQ